MATLTIRMPDDKAERLKSLAEHQDVSVNKLMEELATYAIAQFDTENRFRARQARGSAKHGLALLDELDAHFADRPKTPSYALHEREAAPFKHFEPDELLHRGKPGKKPKKPK